MTAIVLVLFSALVHASWNLVGKRSRPAAVFFGIASLTGAVLLAPLAIVWRETVLLMPASVWWRLLPTALFQTLYFTGLAGAYRTGDMSVAYPIARALPILLVPVISLIIGQGEVIGTLSLAGMVVVTLGVLLVMQRSLRDFSWVSFRAGWFGFALLSGIGTTGYSILDDAALRSFREAVGGGAASIQAPIIYGLFESLFTAVGLFLATLIRYGPGRTGREIRELSLGEAVLAGIGIVLAYGLVLVAFGYAGNVSYVVAFRQTSLPLGAFLAAAILRERVTGPRIVGTFVLVAGLVMVALG